MKDQASIDSEAVRMATKLASITRKQMFAAARRMSGRGYRDMPNWVFAMELFGLGSTYAYAICREMGIDPDAKTAKMETRDAR